MDLGIKDKLFVVLGASSGFGLSITNQLLNEGAHVIINARGEERLLAIQSQAPDKIEVLVGDITTDATISKLIRMIGDRNLNGIVVNASGPPAKSFLDTELTDWDQAYESLLRWKIKITQELLDKMVDQSYGRFLYIESASVKQPIANLVLSNAMRLAVVGFVKTLSQEVARKGITLNILAPGYHATPAMERLFIKKATLLGISPNEARAEFEQEVETGKLGNPDDLATLAVWLLSPHSQYITGQTVSVDGGLIKSTMG